MFFFIISMGILEQNALQPTRTFGDFYMKHSEFNTKEVTSLLGYLPFEKFKGNYIRSDPKITTCDITPEDKFIVVGSDGLWDDVSCASVASELLSKNNRFTNNLAEPLLTRAMAHVSETAGKELEQIKALLPGPSRRKAHDDISILVVNLKDQKGAH